MRLANGKANLHTVTASALQGMKMQNWTCTTVSTMHSELILNAQRMEPQCPQVKTAHKVTQINQFQLSLGKLTNKEIYRQTYSSTADRDFFFNLLK